MDHNLTLLEQLRQGLISLKKDTPQLSQELASLVKNCPDAGTRRAAYKAILDNYALSPSENQKGRLLDLLLQIGAPQTAPSPDAVALFFPSTTNLPIMLDTLKRAKKFCWVCIYSLSNDEISATLYWLHSKGVDVRIITDDETLDNQGSDIRALASFGLPVKVDNDPAARIHHKFAVIDDDVLINGSFNWTVQAVRSNHENMVITHEKKLVVDFKAEFGRMWAKIGSMPQGTEQPGYLYTKYLKNLH